MAEENDVQVAGEGSSLTHVVARHADRLKYYVLAGVAVCIIAGLLFDNQRRAAATRARESADQTFRTVMDLRADPDADAVSLFNGVAREYAGLPGGIQARLLEFAFAYNTGEYAKAESAAREFIKTYPNNVMVGRAKLALGQALLEQGKTADAIDVFRELAAVPGEDVFPEAKLSLAQALEKEAEAARGDENEYRRRLELAEAEYTDILSRARIPIPSQRGHWPQVVVLAADYALVLIKDRIAGHEPATPTPLRQRNVAAEMPADLSVPTGDETEETPAETAADGDAPAGEEAEPGDGDGN